MADPLMPPTQRFPMNPLVIPADMAQPGQGRPFILRGLAPAKYTAVAAKHRTPMTQRTIPQETNLDNRVVDDSYTAHSPAPRREWASEACFQAWRLDG